MSFENRGGVPVVRRLSVTTTGTAGAEGLNLRVTTKYLQIANEGASSVRLYFSQADFDGDTNYIELSASDGFFEGPVEASRIWFKASGGSSDPLVLVAYARRG